MRGCYLSCSTPDLERPSQKAVLAKQGCCLSLVNLLPTSFLVRLLHLLAADYSNRLKSRAVRLRFPGAKAQVLVVYQPEPGV